MDFLIEATDITGVNSTGYTSCNGVTCYVLIPIICSKKTCSTNACPGHCWSNKACSPRQDPLGSFDMRQ